MTVLPLLSLIAALANAQNSTPTPERIFERLLPEAEVVIPGPKVEIKLVIDPTGADNAHACGPGTTCPDKTHPSLYRVVIGQKYIEACQNADELAGILAHEIAHIRLGHSDSGSDDAAFANWSKRMQVDHPDEFAELGNPRSFWWTTPDYAEYSRGNESAADKYASDIVIRAGFRGEARVDFYRREAKKHPEWEASRPEATHPASSERAEAAAQRTQALQEFLKRHPHGPWDASYEANQP